MADIDWERVVNKMVTDTRQKLIRWEKAKQSLQTTAGESVNDVYISEIARKRIAVYEYSYKHWTDVDEYRTETEVAIDMIDPNGQFEWRFPQCPGRWSLLEAIRYNESGAADFMRSYLG